MKATFSFNLPDEQGDYDRARLGSVAISVLWDIDQTCRGLLKHCEPTPEQAALAQQIRDMIPGELLEV